MERWLVNKDFDNILLLSELYELKQWNEGARQFNQIVEQ